MKTKVGLLAVIGSQRMNGNSYYLAKTVLDSLSLSTTKQFSWQKRIVGFCTLCEHCKDGSDCSLQDDFNDILKEMRSADGLVLLC